MFQLSMTGRAEQGADLQFPLHFLPVDFVTDTHNKGTDLQPLQLGKEMVKVHGRKTPAVTAELTDQGLPAKERNPLVAVNFLPSTDIFPLSFRILCFPLGVTRLRFLRVVTSPLCRNFVLAHPAYSIRTARLLVYGEILDWKFSATSMFRSLADLCDSGS